MPAGLKSHISLSFVDLIAECPRLICSFDFEVIEIDITLSDQYFCYNWIKLAMYIITFPEEDDLVFGKSFLISQL